MVNFFSEHWIIGWIIASLVWFIAGQQSLANKNINGAIGFDCVAVLLIVILCVWAVVRMEWLGFACGLAVLYLEVRSIRRLLKIDR